MQPRWGCKILLNGCPRVVRCAANPGLNDGIPLGFCLETFTVVSRLIQHLAHGREPAFAGFGRHRLFAFFIAVLDEFRRQLLQIVAQASIIEADLLVMVAAALTDNLRWFPQTIYYAGYGKTPPFFLRSSQHKHFKKLVAITGIETAEELRTKVKVGIERMKISQMPDYSFHANTSFWDALNMDKLDSIN